MGLAVVRGLRERRVPTGPEELVDFETDVLAGFVLARASVELADGTIRSDIGHLEQTRIWFGRPLWDTEPADADAYFGRVLRGSAKGTRLARAQALTTFFAFLELRHQVEIHAMTGRIVEWPIDEMNKPRGRKQAALRIPPTDAEIQALFTGWRQKLVGPDRNPVSSLRKNLVAAVASRREVTRMSRTFPCWPTARHR
jgi:hypothetical protein